MAYSYQGEFSDFSYEFIIYSNRDYRMPFRMTPFKPLPNSDQRWQFEFACTSPSGKVITLEEFYRDDDSQIRVTLFKHVGFIPKTIEWSGVISLDRISCAMAVSNCRFHFKYNKLINKQNFIFEKKSGSVGEADSDIHIECKMFVWGLKPPTSEVSTEHPQQPNSSNGVLKAIKQIYLDAILTDVVFTIDDMKLAAHKCVLGARSEVFRKMFEADMLEKRSSTIPIMDCDSQTFSQFLQFLYTGELDDNLQSNMASLFAMADKYNVEDLRIMCVKEMCSSIAADNAVTVLVCAYLHDDKEMKELAKTYICDNFLYIACQREWGELLITYPDLAAEVGRKINCNN